MSLTPMHCGCYVISSHPGVREARSIPHRRHDPLIPATKTTGLTPKPSQTAENPPLGITGASVSYKKLKLLSPARRNPGLTLHHPLYQPARQRLRAWEELTRGPNGGDRSRKSSGSESLYGGLRGAPECDGAIGVSGRIGTRLMGHNHHRVAWEGPSQGQSPDHPPVASRRVP
jgi:hypothetical protein